MSDADYHDTETQAVRVQTGPCDTCRHRDPDAPSTCWAFPEGIPIDVIIGRHDHRTPLEGDHGYRWTPRPAESTAGPVRYVVIAQLDDDGWTTLGAVWAAADRADTGGFIPAPGVDAEQAWAQELDLRRAWRNGHTPLEVVEAWSDRGGAGALVGSEGRDAARFGDMLLAFDR